jgi:hypothetical protein
VADTFIPLELPPGIFANGTRSQAQGRWHDANLVRFFDKTVRPVGGWRNLRSDSNADFAPLLGVPRAAIAWRTDAEVIQVFGTTQKLYAILGGTMHDITPVGFVAGSADGSYATATGAYNAGDYGSGNFGQGSQTAARLDADTWQLSPFGNYLAGVSTSDQKLRVWTGDPAVLPTVVTGTHAPATVRGVVSTPERFLFALGADGHLRRVQWPSQETISNWDYTSPTETAGYFDLVTNGALICGRATRGVTLLWTDADVHAASYIGSPLLYSFSRVGDNCGIISPNAVAMLDGQALWMSQNGFFLYDGYVKQLECEVRDRVFGDMNYMQMSKVWAVVNKEYGEVWFFYPSASSTEIDRYVIYNYQEGHWSIGAMNRTAGYDAGAVQKPVWLDASGAIYEHEMLDGKLTVVPFLLDGTHTLDGSAILDGELSRSTSRPYVDSGPFTLGNGDRLVQIQRIVPDVQPINDLELVLYTANSPTDDEMQHGPYPLSQETDVRITTRHLRFRLQEINQEGWRVGSVKLGVVPSSRR